MSIEWSVIPYQFTRLSANDGARISDSQLLVASSYNLHVVLTPICTSTTLYLVPLLLGSGRILCVCFGFGRIYKQSTCNGMPIVRHIGTISHSSWHVFSIYFRSASESFSILLFCIRSYLLSPLVSEKSSGRGTYVNKVYMSAISYANGTDRYTETILLENTARQFARHFSP